MTVIKRSIIVALTPLALLIGSCGVALPLGQSCGGIAGLACAGPFFCFYESGCGAGDALGECMPIPEVCAEINDPVCGCDGQTYSQQCFAWMAGINVASEGECAAP